MLRFTAKIQSLNLILYTFLCYTQSHTHEESQYKHYNNCKGGVGRSEIIVKAALQHLACTRADQQLHSNGALRIHRGEECTY